MRDSFLRTILVALVLCFFGSLLVSGFAVGLREKQELNVDLDRKKNVLYAVNLLSPDEKITPEGIEKKFKDIEKVVILRETGEITKDDPAVFDELAALSSDSAKWLMKDMTGEENIKVAEKLILYKVFNDDQLVSFVLPIYGKGLWNEMKGFIAIKSDLSSVIGLTYYQHGETPGLGGEVDNPKWKKLWEGRKIYNDDMKVLLGVIKGMAGTVEEDPYHIDGLSGATLTSGFVTSMVRFWLGEYGFLKYLEKNKVKG